MKYLSIIIIGCTFLLSGCIGLALDNLSEAVLLADSVVSSSGNTTLLHYLFILLLIVGIGLIVHGLMHIEDK